MVKTGETKAKKVIKGSAWMFAMSWYSRLLGMATLIVLARCLDKYDFGVIAGCFVVQGFFAAISNIDSGIYLMRKKNITEEDLDAAWTISVFSKLFIAGVIFFLSDYLALFMNIPELADAMKAMCLASVFIGLVNPAINIKIKNLDFSKLFYLDVVTKTISSSTSIFIAVVYNSYWAVIIAEIVARGLYAGGSYFVSEYKPKVSFNLLAQWTFTKWLLLKGVAAYVKTATDKIMVSRYYSVPELGVYNFSMESSSTALQFLIAPVQRLIYPSLSDYLDNTSLLIDKLNKFILVLSLIYIPIVFGGVYLADTIVPVVFGEQWLEVVPIFQLFLIMSIATLLNDILTDVFTLTGKLKKMFFYETSVAIVVICSMYAFTYLAFEQFVILRVIVAFCILAALLIVLRTIIPVSVKSIITICMPAVLSSGFMLTTIYFVDNYQVFGNEILNLIFLIMLGAVAYLAVISVMITKLKSRYGEIDFVYKNFYLPVIKMLRAKFGYNT
ncbi:oligosaccharide flippase family protein [Vibrio sp. HN007]|uniref:oligosaccharide flippase family protein n=1 Tax=Vibrio iocasae TaxID=3098914 RepID=UPI0035D429B0